MTTLPDIPELPQEPGLYSLREIYRVTEWRDKAVYKTVHVGYAWIATDVPLGRIPGESDLMSGALSSHVSVELSKEGISTIKRVLPKKSK